MTFQEVNDWRPVKGFEDSYLVSRYGEIYSIKKRIILKPSYAKAGYKQYNLSKGKKKYIYLEHRAVALAFVKNPNPDKFNLVNHKDENKQNNYYKNLEWCDNSYNVSYNGCPAGRAVFNDKAKTFYVYDLNMNYIGEFKGIRKFARENNLSSGCLCDAMKANKNKTSNFTRCKNFIPMYKRID